ncbi:MULTISPECIES: T9SS type A sorting domain-containing protein [unclassified Flavobacterium]|uniref:T9SS type A sorting domain-containing protein n=1 Tax=unclassified Flavobacterium TaxID=196869 RepID=UPI000868312A|nr:MULTISPECIES: T9SS type A sorting domain-containing protein [unclassified Flavobacterium]MBN9283479.1 T9SS type A sorting domain-containing protein [Flavobacterium sp.]ODS86232.1 MAG: hypothetical protein ABS44_13720 [Chryseobacterium sp. SCN 40-13]OJV69400.1 MAG: hypothetical protein BGO42_13615 [Flavobacterium sp. 40-81]
MKIKLLLLLTATFAVSGYAQCVTTIFSSDENSFAFRPDGTLWTWGRNQYGQLGDGTKLERLAPIQVVSAVGWKEIAPARMHTVGLKHDGTLWSWGNNEVGQLGAGTAPEGLVPVQVGTATDWKTISGGNLHTLALKNDGTLWGWGNNGAGELGNYQNNTNLFAPTQIGTANDWKAISASYFRSFVIKNNGTLWGCGGNQFGQLGNGNNGSQYVLTQIGTDNDWLKISAARGTHTLALKTNGTLWVWGQNDQRQLGDGTTTNRNTPFQLGTDTWLDIANGTFHSVAVKSDGTLWQWGNTIATQNGHNSVNLPVPTQVGTENDWKSVSAGSFCSFAIKNDNSLWAWGYNGNGRFGDGTTTNQLLPKLVLGCPLGTGEFTAADLNLYPNPVKDKLYWENAPAWHQYEVYSLLGQKIKGGAIASGEQAIGLDNLSSGLYLVTFYTENGQSQKFKILKD